MAHKNQNDKNSVELMIRLKISRAQAEHATLRKWICAILIPVFVKIVIHFLHAG